MKSKNPAYKGGYANIKTMEILSVDGEGEDLRFRVRDGEKEGVVELLKAEEEGWHCTLCDSSVCEHVSFVKNRVDRRVEGRDRLRKALKGHVRREKKMINEAPAS